LDLLKGSYLETPSRRILVVEDYEPFRRFVCSTLSKEPGFQISEAADGLEAVEKAQQLRPELILLDIGLPSLNGIDTARRIRKLLPESKILFVSQESSADVVQEALTSGALGYVVKVHAGNELLPAVEAVLQGMQFVSRGLSGHCFIPSLDSQTLDRPNDPLRPPAEGGTDARRNHEAEFYSDDAAFVVGFTRFIEAALDAGNAVVAVVTESHRKSLLERLGEHGVDMVAAVEEGRYVCVDVADAQASFMVNDLPDPARYMKVAGDLIAAGAKASRGDRPRVALCGECAPVLWEQGKPDAAMEAEHLCDEIATLYDVDILCGYVLNKYQREQERQIYQRICAKHSAVSSL
jgi:DNA-binding NarL/FixJ family response regulator